MPHLSYRYRIPFSLVASALLTALALGLAISFETYRNIVQDRIAEGERLAHALRPVLMQALKHDDVWLAYSLLRGPGRRPPDASDAITMVMTDEHGVVFASSHPRRFHTGEGLAAVDPALARLVAGARGQAGSRAQHALLGDRLALVRGLATEGSYRGALLIVYPVKTFWLRFREIVQEGLWVILLVLVPLILIGWYWGHYMVTPLVQLRDCMVRMRSGDLARLNCRIYQGRDEIGELGRQFQLMLQGLREKQALERQVVSQERLAAIGRLAASVAHEVNNPVGGMLLALDTWKRNRVLDADQERLLSLLERGLRQIHETVSALLVESRVENRPLTPDDIEDVHTLLQARPLPEGAELHWDSRLSDELRLPASAVRQILMNLASNAIEAIGPGQRVEVHIRMRGDTLHIEVGDDGPPIPAERMAHLFEPFHAHRPGGTGLGLWITYQIVEQLGGRIEVHSDPEWTRFSVTLPVGGSAATTDADGDEDRILHRADRG